MKLIKNSILYFLLFLLPYNTKAQDPNIIIDSLLHELKKIQDDSTKIKILARISYLYFTVDPNEGIRHGEDAEKLSMKINWKKGLAYSYQSLASNYWTKKELVKAQDYFWKAYKINESLNDKPAIARSIHSLAVLYQTLHMYSLAKENFEKASLAFRELGDSAALAGSLANIANSYQMQKDLPKAIEFYLRSSQIAVALNNKPMLAYYHVRLGSIYADLGNFTEAMKYQKSSLSTYESARDDLHIANINREIARIFFLQVKYDSALYYYQKSISLFKKIKGQEGMANLAEIYSGIGKIYKLQSKDLLPSEKLRLLQKAAEYQKEAIEISIPFKIWELLKEYYFELSDIEKMRKNFESSLNYYKIYSQLKDSLYDAEKVREFTKNEIQHDFERKESKIKIEQERILTASENTNTLVILASLLIILSLLFSFLFLRQKILKKRAIEKANTSKKMLELELQSIRAQLNPHFMFNSLNAIQELIVTDKTEIAQSYLERFAKLLRILLENATHPFILLRKEIIFLEHYLSLENLRIPDLKYSIKIDPEVNPETALMPNMMLQPYIENALWHGLQHKRGEKKLLLNINLEKGTLNFEIRDNGIGRKKAEELKSLYQKEHRSKGMELLSKRFSLLSKEFGQKIQTEVIDIMEHSKPAGTCVKIRIPYGLSESNKFANDQNDYHR